MAAEDTKTRVRQGLQETIGRAMPGQDDHRFLEHALTPLHIGILPRPSGQAVGVGSCGDSLEVALLVDQGNIVDIRIMPNGCMHTVACASALGELVMGKKVEQALEVEPGDIDAALGGLPADHQHCARLAVNTFGEAVEDYYRRSNRKPA